jgi:hypothetical protein
VDDLDFFFQDLGFQFPMVLVFFSPEKSYVSGSCARSRDFLDRNT